MDSDVMLIELIKDGEYPSDEKLNKDDDLGEDEFEGNHFDKFPTCSELAYHKSFYNWIMTARLAPRKNPKSPSGLNNFTGRVKGMHIFVGNFTYVLDFMIIEDISLVIDPRVSRVVLGKPFIKLSSMTYDSSLGVVRLTNVNEEIAYKMPYKIEQYDSLSNDEKENMKSVYLRNDEDKKKGVKYIISKILGFYKECLKFRPVPSVDEPDPQPLPNLPFLYINLGDKKGPEPLIKPHNPGSFRVKVIFDKEKPRSS
ncbi:hypothetical protein Tco_1242089 [Tanacetum coccineum]